MPHTTADDPKRYRDESEAKVWIEREPMKRFKKYLQNKNILNSELEAQLEAELDSDIKEAVQRAEALARSEEYSNPLSMFGLFVCGNALSPQSAKGRIALLLAV